MNMRKICFWRWHPCRILLRVMSWELPDVSEVLLALSSGRWLARPGVQQTGLVVFVKPAAESRRVAECCRSRWPTWPPRWLGRPKAVYMQDVARADHNAEEYWITRAYTTLTTKHPCCITHALKLYGRFYWGAFYLHKLNITKRIESFMRRERWNVFSLYRCMSSRELHTSPLVVFSLQHANCSHQL
jgi:hypothetical protein